MLGDINYISHHICMLRQNKHNDKVIISFKHYPICFYKYVALRRRPKILK